MTYNIPADFGITEKQRRYLRHLGYPNSSMNGMSRATASRLISELTTVEIVNTGHREGCDTRIDRSNQCSCHLLPP